MSRRQLAWVMAMAMLALLVTVSAPAFPQSDVVEGGQAAAATDEPVEAQPASESPEKAVEKILRQQEALLKGQHFAYDPANRRDPFRSLYETLRQPRNGPRPPGVRGMMVMDVDLVGIVKDPNGGDVGLLMGSDNKGYFMRVGDAVYDATLIAVDPRLGTVTFRQQVDDPRLIKPYRDVVKRLVPQTNEESVDE